MKIVVELPKMHAQLIRTEIKAIVSRARFSELIQLQIHTQLNYIKLLLNTSGLCDVKVEPRILANEGNENLDEIVRASAFVVPSPSPRFPSRVTAVQFSTTSSSLSV